MIVLSIYAVGILSAALILFLAETDRFEPHAAFLAFAFILVVLGYGLPTFVAFARRHRYWVVILAANVFLGFTVVGWLFCLAAAFGWIRVPKRLLNPIRQ